MTENESMIVINIIALFMIFLLLLVFYLKKIIPFMRKKDYIKMEMERSQGSEYRHWERKLKRHYLRQIPIFGNMIIKKYYKSHKKTSN